VVEAAKAPPTQPGVHVGIDSAEIPLTDALRTQIVPLKSAGVAEVMKDLGEVLRKVMGEGGQVAISTYSNAFLLTGRSEGIHRAAQILKVIDQTASAQLRMRSSRCSADATVVRAPQRYLSGGAEARIAAGLPGLLRMTHGRGAGLARRRTNDPPHGGAPDELDPGGRHRGRTWS
jgi:hypothetical protein